MSAGTQSLAEVKDELLEEIAEVDRKVEAVDRKVEAVDRKVDAVEQRLVERIEAVDRKVEAVDRKVDAVEQRLVERIEAVDRKVDALGKDFREELRETRTELVNLINATAIGLEHRIDKKLEQMDNRIVQMEERLVKAAERGAEAVVDRALERALGLIYERARSDVEVLDDKIVAVEHKVERHIANERIHHIHRSGRR